MFYVTMIFVFWFEKLTIFQSEIVFFFRNQRVLAGRLAGMSWWLEAMPVEAAADGHFQAAITTNLRA